MAVKTLYQAGAFGYGSDLWVIPTLESSSWSQRIDWYLNYQISRSKQHTSLELPSELADWLAEINWESAQEYPKEIAKPQTSPLLIASQGRLPTHQVVELPLLEAPVDWLAKAHSVWKQLGFPTLRLFLPEGITQNDVQSNWPSSWEEDNEISLVPVQASMP